MNIDKYQYYLKCNGKWDSFAGNEIQTLLKFEKDLQIDLDNFIPYNENYFVIETLNSMMTDEMKYNERLQFAINRYMVYKLNETNE